MAPTSTLTTDDLRRLVLDLGHRTPVADDAERLDRLRLLEDLRAATAAAQAEEVASFAASQISAAADAGVRSTRRSRGIAGQVGLALRCSPHEAARRIGFAKIVTGELPATHDALRSGRISEWKAILLARETATLSLEDRLEVDAAMAPELETMSAVAVECEARRMAQWLDPQAAVDRAARATGERRVSLRPAPDPMCWLGALVPLVQGVAAYASLGRAADQAAARGDARGRGQVMADTLVERITGQAHAGDVPVEVVLVMPADTLLNRGDEPAELLAPGVAGSPVDGITARNLAVGDPTTPDYADHRWLRLLFTTPDGSRLASMDTSRREFTDNQRPFLMLRDRTCRTPWCDAPIRHADHVVGHGAGGRTSVDNGQGLCAACNYAKQAPRWAARARPDGTVVIRTPTGHRYASREPVPLARPADNQPVGRLTSTSHRRPRGETVFAQVLMRYSHAA